MRHVPALDGVRGLAVTAVVLVHTQVPVLTGGARGVDVFFVLSGFLITGLLKAECDGDGIAVGRFLIRRSLRLMPALLTYLAVNLALGTLLYPETAAELWRDALIAGTYLMNYFLVFAGRANFSHTWSLAIEEQFYLLWPFVLPPLLRLRDPAKALLVLWAGLTLLRPAVMAVSDSVGDAYFPLHAHASGLVLGAFLAVSPRLRPGFGWVGWAGLIGLGLLLVIENPADGGLGAVTWQIALSEVATAAMIAGVGVAPGLTRLLSWRPLTLLGLISYGVYLWHAFVANLLRDAPWYLAAPLTLAASVCLAAASYLTVEAAGRRLRARLAPKPAQIAPEPA